MNILIVEDTESKLNNIIELVNDLESSYSIVKSYQSAYQKVKEQQFDWLILDMTLPESEDMNSPLITLAGLDLVEQMDFDEIVLPTIILTGYDRFGRYDDFVSLEELRDELSDEFPDIVKDVVYYSGYSEDWKLSIKSILGEK
ncbi:response regulator [Vibrio harveyi]|uniref:response regulator n=1 Tax=Vibrio harveyi TaxID=669 RepID=UPI000C7C3639|nr:response regulator [Vibrio harveyi]